MKSKIMTLDNGLKLILTPDKNKNRTTATITTYAGGLHTHFKYGNKEYKVVNGIAHFLEHYLLENSIYGDAMSLFDNDYIEANGLTYRDKTSYYISTVHDFEDNFIKLINIVNNPLFDEDKIEDVKKPIISEINRALDNPNRKFGECVNNGLFKNYPYDPTLGTPKDIKNMTIDDIKIFHEAFYQPSNQAIIISGNFDIKKIINIINNEYAKLDRKHKKVKALIEKEPVEVNKKRCKITENKEGIISVSFKFDVSKYSPIEKNKLDYYLGYILSNNFSEKSKIFKTILERKISVYSISSDYRKIPLQDLAMVVFRLTTNKQKEAEDIILDRVNNLEYDEESFDTFIKQNLINIILDSESAHNTTVNLVGNIEKYEYYKNDDIKFINSLSLKECKEMIDKLDFSNMSIAYRIRGE